MDRSPGPSLAVASVSIGTRLPALIFWLRKRRMWVRGQKCKSWWKLIVARLEHVWSLCLQHGNNHDLRR
jgi:hypothetical protein